MFDIFWPCEAPVFWPVVNQWWNHRRPPFPRFRILEFRRFLPRPGQKKIGATMDLLSSQEALVLQRRSYLSKKNWGFSKNMAIQTWTVYNEENHGKWMIRCLPTILGHLQSNLWHCQGSVTTVAFICFMSASACSISRTCATKTDTKPQSEHLHSFGNIINIQNICRKHI